jgi:DNA-directed RNA polymerase specialized sigma subunit
MNVEKFLKDSLNIEKEAWAAAEAIESLVLRKNGQADVLIEEYAQDLTYMENRANTVAKMVQTLPEEDMRRVFAARYLHKMTWEETAEATFLSVMHVHRLHKKGLAWLEGNWSLL